MARKRKPSRGKSGYQPRRINAREPLQRFLIVCEGTRTEPHYFDGFKVPSVKIMTVGTGYDPLAVVKDAIERSHPDDFDQIWCVFDRDDVTPDLFNQALHQAEVHNKRNKHKIRIAYSNQAFELWFLLHFQYSDSALARPDYLVRLDELLNERYQKNDREMYRKLLARQATAIQNAERLLSQYDPVNPVADDPSTTVHLLVQELNRFVQHTRLS